MNNTKQIQAQLRLFKSYVTNNIHSVFTDNITLNKDYVKYGIFFNPHSNELPECVVKIAIDMYGKDGAKWNKTFHKSFSTVRDTDLSELIAQQLIHYFTTYGLETLNLYDTDLVYIPIEQLDIPQLQENVPLIVINEITEEMLHDKLMNLLTSDIALSQQTIEDIICLSDYLTSEDLEEINNTEIKITLYDKFNIVPKNSTFFLRYLIYKLTESTLLIKSKELYSQIQYCDIEILYNYLVQYVQQPYGYIKLANIFLRYKPLFLAMKRKTYSKKSKQINAIINRVSKLSKKYHKVVGIPILDNMTSIKTIKEVLQKVPTIQNELDKCSIFRKIRILNGINYRLNSNNDFDVYKIRNGKAWVEPKQQISLEQKQVLLYLQNLVQDNIAAQIQPKLKDKSIYLPDNIIYKVPQSEKQFVGNIPEGSYIEIPKTDNLVIGISWKNVKTRVDLDLKAVNKTETYGWDGLYKCNDPQESFYFSGDVTNAESGATELFYVGRNVKDKSFMLCVNNYTCNPEDVPFELVVAKCNDTDIDYNYVIDPNNIITTIPFKMEQKQNFKTIGFVNITQENIQVYFREFNLGAAITTTDSKLTEGAYDYLTQFNKYQLSINDLLFICNICPSSSPVIEQYVQCTQTTEDKTPDTLYKKIITPVDYDLSLDKLDKTTIVKLLS